MYFEKLKYLVKIKLGEELEREDENSVSDLNELTADQIEKLRRLDSDYDAYSLLEFYVTSDNDRYLRRFIVQVVRGEKSVENWAKGKIWVPDVSIKDNLSKSIDKVYRGLELDYTQIVLPRHEAWMSKFRDVGCFACVDEGANYKTKSIDGFMPNPIGTKLVQVSADDKPLWFRRWVANQMASCIKFRDGLESPISKRSLTEFVPEDEWTEDAQIAFDALVEEQKQGLWTEAIIPGYPGSRELYLPE